MAEEAARDMIRQKTQQALRTAPPEPESEADLPEGIDAQRVAARIQLFGRLLTPVEQAPWLFRFNGCGTTLLGILRDEPVRPEYFTRLFFTFLWISIIPLGIYLVLPRYNAGRTRTEYVFLGRMTPDNFHSFFAPRIARFYCRAVAEALIIGLAVVGLLLLVGWLIHVLGGGRVVLRGRF